MSHRVIVWGTGVVGKLVIRELLDHPEFELAAVIVHDPAKDGVDVGELIGGQPVGVRATTDSAAALALDADAVAYFGPTAEFAVQNIENMSAALRSGKHVVSTSMTPLVYPKPCPPEVVAELEKACADSGKACFTTGIDPGFANDLFPMTLMGVCGRVDTVRIQELLDDANYAGDYSSTMGIGAPVEQKSVLEYPEILIFAWGHTIPMIADAVGVELDRIDTSYEKWAATEPIEFPHGVMFIGGGTGCQVTYKEFLDRILAAMGMRPLPARAFADKPYATDWVDTTDSQRLLQYQRYDFDKITADIAAALGWKRHLVLLARPFAERAMLKMSPYYR